MKLVAPKLPGKYCAFFRFVHGDNHRFGQKVWCDILVQDNSVEMIKPSFQVDQKSNASGSGSHAQEERSSLLNESDQQQMIQQNLIDEQKPLLFENLGDQYE